MITVFLRGGLGNQMFQYAAGLSLAKKNNARLLLDTTFLNDRFPRKEFTYRTYDMDVFTVQPEFTKLSSLSTRFPVPGIWLGLDLALMKAREVFGIQKAIREKEDHKVDASVLDERGNILLYGRWQSEKYFADVRDEVRAAFTFRHPLEGEAAEIAREIASSNAVALCARRGDFVAFAGVKKLMGDTNTSYYERAVAYMNKRVKNPRYFVFADDIEWCRANLGMPEGTRYIGELGPKWSFHLRLMSMCKYSIITNSTFYWWGAWLNADPERVVVAPAKWFPGGPDAEDIIPAGWEKI